MSTSVEAFCRRFRGFVLLCGVFGVYIPGVDSLIPQLRKLPVFYCYSLIFYLVSLHTGVDWYVLVFRFSKELGSFMTFHISIAGGIFIWSAINIIYIFLQRKTMGEIIAYWNDQLHPKLWPKERYESIEVIYRNALKKCYIIFGVVAGPYVIHGTYKIYMKELYQPSNFGIGLTPFSGYAASVMQCLSVICGTAGTSLHQSWFSFLLNCAVVELTYLKNTMDRVINYPHVNFDGSFEIGDTEEIGSINTKSYKNMSQIMRKRLILVIDYHIRCIRFFNLIKKFYAPIVAFEYFFLTTCLCGLAYGASSGALPKDIAFYSFLMLSVYSYINMLHCRLGHKAMELGQSISMSCFHGNWMIYPLEIQKMVLVIMTMCSQKRLTINLYGILHLILPTFHTMALLQYKFYRFMAETVKH